MMSPTLVLVIFFVVALLYHLIFERPKEKNNAEKIYCLTRKDIMLVVRYGFFAGILGMIVGRSLNFYSYWSVVVLAFLWLVSEVAYRMVAVPFLARREVSKA